MGEKLFDDETESWLKTIFSGLRKNVTNYLAISDNCKSCGEAIVLAKELDRVSSSKVTFKIINSTPETVDALKIRYYPGFIYGTRKKNIRYYGLPSGHEFAPFIYIHQYLANDEINIPGEIINTVESIETPLHVKVFVTPECPYCPYVVDAVNQMGLVNDQLLVETIEALEFPEEADMYNVMYVPSIAITRVEEWRITGVKPLDIIHGYVEPDAIVKALIRAQAKLKRSER